MTEVCSSPSKANDNYKSKMVIRVFIIVFIHITTVRNNYFKCKVCLLLPQKFSLLIQYCSENYTKEF